MQTTEIITVVGARPQFVKAAVVSRAIASFNDRSSDSRLNERLVHTAQHYDENMSKVFFDQLRIPQPWMNLAVGSGSHGWQTGEMLEKLEEVLLAEEPDCVLIYGDTNSTLAGALAAAKLHILVAHVEAGLRSFNRRMPEEINRVLADRISGLLLCPTVAAVKNLAGEGITEGVYNVGDVMYDSMLFNSNLAGMSSDVMRRLGLAHREFYLATIHRAENTDDPHRLKGILDALAACDYPVILPLHPRTQKVLDRRQQAATAGIRVVDPVSYWDMLVLQQNARIILTDSGGVQKEAYWASVPCVTLRDETEWVELVECGCNRLAGGDRARILRAVREIEAAGAVLHDDRPTDLYGSGRSAEKIVTILVDRFCSRE